MTFNNKFIKTKGYGREGVTIGYYVPRLYRVYWRLGLKVFGLSYIKERLNGWTIWFVTNEEDYIQAIKTLRKLQKTRVFIFKVSRDLNKEG